MLFCLLRIFFQINFFKKNLLGIPSECQTDWIQIRSDILSGLIRVQTVFKSYQQTTLGDNELILTCFLFFLIFSQIQTWTILIRHCQATQPLPSPPTMYLHTRQMSSHHQICVDPLKKVRICLSWLNVVLCESPRFFLKLLCSRQCGPRSDCSSRSSLILIRVVCRNKFLT